jgi:8-amino-7-oxononanoate synthase
MGTIPALVGRGDAIYSDEKNHASIIDGCRLSRAEVHTFGHRDADELERLLKGGSDYRRRLIVTDSVFSMDGDLAPLEAIADLADEFGAMLMVDEAHATGVFGSQGRGLAEALGVERRIHVRVGTLSKALGSSGGFVTGSRQLIGWLANRARSYIFSTAHPPAASAAALAALDVVATEPQRRLGLLKKAGRLRDQLRATGWNLGASASQIIPVMVGDPERTMHLAARLRASGLLVSGIRPPSVPPGESLLRVSLTSAHAPDMIERLAAALGDCRRAL